jgi:hypothetical protein
MSPQRLDPQTRARACRCGSGAIPYTEGDEPPSCAKCGHPLEAVRVDSGVGASIGVEARTGYPPPGPRPEPAQRPTGRDRARPSDAEPPPASIFAPQAGSGPSFDWPFGPEAANRPRRQRPGGAR